MRFLVTLLLIDVPKFCLTEGKGDKVNRKYHFLMVIQPSKGYRLSLSHLLNVLISSIFEINHSFSVSCSPADAIPYPFVCEN